MKPGIARFAALAIASAVLAASPADQISPAFDALFRAYESGDYDVVVRALPTRAQYQPLERDFERARLAWRKTWRRVQSVFFLEVATVAFRHSWSDKEKVLRDARAFLMARPGAVFKTGADDSFEVLWHRAALAVLQGSLEANMMDQYLEQVAHRIGATPAAPGQPARLIEPRLALIHAMAEELGLLPGIIRSGTTMLGGRLIQTTRQGAAPGEVNEMLARLDVAAGFDVNRVETAIRRANVLVRTNRAVPALAALDAHAGPLQDNLLQYWRDLLRARALDISEQLDDAAQSYTAARVLFPRAQSPIVALGALRFRQGNLTEARHWTTLVRALPPDAEDPWSLYWYGDSRFFEGLLIGLREAAK